jgi:2-polyprenyl-6-hydroxyphenyl methylase / 3-demethylubiquinone-9 3-methyltransferase
MASNPENSTINPGEAAHFGKQAADWWDPQGASAMLHKLGPARLAYLRAAIDRHWQGDHRSLRPLEGRRALDIGCGAGLVSEPLARLGAAVTAIDAAAENIAVARAHADAMALAIDYRAGGVEALDEPAYDLIVSLEVIEHVTDPALFLRHVARLLRPDGLLVLSTPNRTALSRLMVVTLAEGTGQIPRGTHDWSRFLTPDELTSLLGAQGLHVIDRRGLSADPRFGFVLSDNLQLNYLLTAVPADMATPNP